MQSLTSSQSQQQSQQQSSIQDSSQSSMNTVIPEVIASFSSRDMSQKSLSVAIKSNANIIFFHEMRSIEKTFRIEEIVIRENDEKARLEKIICMSDQRFEMNVIFESLQQHLKLLRNELTSIDFRELIMHTANHREISLIYWIEFLFEIEDIVRIIRCFISSDLHLSDSALFEHFSLLLRLSFLYSVNAYIFIRESKIIIDDSTLSEIIREIIDLEMIFCNEHTLIMYSKKIFRKKIEKILNNEDEKSDISESENSLFETNDKNDF